PAAHSGSGAILVCVHVSLVGARSMPRRYLDALTAVPSTLAYGLRPRLKAGYSVVDFRADLMAGLGVGVVALPLSMALAIASGVAPQYGLCTALVAGVVCALLG